jgi:gliding-associated putative ABC transporter substrate-binding component GldG
MGRRKGIDGTVFVLAVIGILVFINILSFKFPGRADLTRDKEFSLDQVTIDTLEDLADPVTVRAYVTGDLPPREAIIARRIKDILNEYYADGSGNFRYEFIDPLSEETEADKKKRKEIKRDIFGRAVREATSIEQELNSLGISDFQVRANEEDKLVVKKAYMGLAVQYGENQEVIPRVTAQSLSTLEYNLTTLIRKVSREKTPKIALITGHQNPDMKKNMSVMNELLEKIYDLATIDLVKNTEIGDDVDAILLIGPKTPFSEDEKRAIDQFIMSGRPAAFLLSSLDIKLQTLESEQIDHGLTDLMASYGVTIEPGLVLDGDEYLTIPATQQQGNRVRHARVPYPFIPLLKSLTSDHPITRKLSRVALPFMSPLALNIGSESGVRGQVLASSSDQSWVQLPPYNLDPFQRWTRDKISDMGPRNLMVILQGPIKSHFAGTGEEVEKAVDARVLVASGYAFLQDAFLGRSASNQALALNLVDWLVMDESLLEIRSRGLAIAPLDELSAISRNLVKYGNIAGLPLVFIGFGLIRWRMRESRRKKVKL